MTQFRIRTAILAAVVTAVAAPTVAHAERDVEALVRRADMALRGDSSAAVFSMDIKTKSYERSYSIVAWDDRKGKKARSLIKILGPALWRGYGTLKVGSQLKIYNPKTNHIAVVQSSMLGDAWMGSHFSNDDLVKETELARDYDVELLDENTGTSGLGKDSTILRAALRPRPTAPVAWARIEYTIAVKGDVVIPVQADYFRKKGQRKPSRTMTFDGVKKLGGRLLPSRMTMTVASKPGEYTRITYKKLKFGVKVPGSKFTEQGLRK